MAGLKNRLQRQRDAEGERWRYTFANGLLVSTDPFLRADPMRVLPLGGMQDMVLNRLVHFPELVAGKTVLDACAGSGVFGLMALRLGAVQVDFLDISPRAQAFQQENARANGFAAARYRALLGSIADHPLEARYDLVIANPPFVPTPAGIAGTVASNGGAEGNAVVSPLIARLDAVMRDDAQAYVYIMQLALDGAPLIAGECAAHLPERAIEFTSVQSEPIRFDDYAAAYELCFPQRSALIARWAADLRERYGAELGVQHYIMHVQAKDKAAAGWVVTESLAEKYIEGPNYPAAANRELARARVLENYIPD